MSSHDHWKIHFWLNNLHSITVFHKIIALCLTLFTNIILCCNAGLKVKKTVIRMTVRSDVDLTDSTISDALLEKVKGFTNNKSKNKGLCYF